MIDNTDRIAQAQLIAMWMKAEGIRSIALPDNDVSTFTMHWQEEEGGLGYYGSTEVPQLPPGTNIGTSAEEFDIIGNTDIMADIKHRPCGQIVIGNVTDLRLANKIASHHVCATQEDLDNE